MSAREVGGHERLPDDGFLFGLVELCVFESDHSGDEHGNHRRIAPPRQRQTQLFDMGSLHIIVEPERKRQLDLGECVVVGLFWAAAYFGKMRQRRVESVGNFVVGCREDKRAVEYEARA